MNTDNSTNELGMYAIADPDYPQVKVGKYTICRQDSERVWIAHESGEGGEFKDASFEKVIDDFFQNNF